MMTTTVIVLERFIRHRSPHRFETLQHSMLELVVPCGARATPVLVEDGVSIDDVRRGPEVLERAVDQLAEFPAVTMLALGQLFDQIDGQVRRGALPQFAPTAASLSARRRRRPSCVRL